MRNVSTPDSPALAPVQLDGTDTLECCAGCKYWNRAHLQKTPQGVAAPCRRYPPTAALATHVVPGPQGPRPQQVPCVIYPMAIGTEWCGEFKLHVP